MTMRFRGILGTAATAVLVLSACGGTSPAGAEPASPDASASEGAAETTPAVEPPAADDPAARFDPALFGADSATIDNEWLPLTAGTRFTWEGRALDDAGEVLERRVVLVATDLTKDVGGVRALVAWERDFTDGVQNEGELIFLAQDTEGTVWHLGQYTEVYEDEFVGGRVWVVGDPVEAQAGIFMMADPASVEASYAQGYAPPPWNWDDEARLRETVDRICVPAGCYQDVVVIEEYEPSVPDAFQLKYYARGVGNVEVGWEGANETEQEELQLVERVELTPEQVAEARAAALELEHRALAYARLGPAQPLDGAASPAG